MLAPELCGAVLADRLGDQLWVEQVWKRSSQVQGRESLCSYFVEPAVIHLGMWGESAHRIFKATQVFSIFSLESLLILCVLLHLTGIRAQTLAGGVGER